MCSNQGMLTCARHFGWTLVISLLTGSPHNGVALASDQSLLQRFHAEAPKAWKSHEDFWLSLEGTSKGERREVRNGNWVKTVELKRHWKQCNHNTLDQLELRQPDGWRGTVQGRNKQYTFRLMRDNETRPWVIQEVVKLENDSPDPWEDRKSLTLSLILFSPRGLLLPQLHESPGFKVADVVREPDSAEELARLTFSYSPANSEDTNQLRGGWLVLDPLHDWVIRKGELDLDPKGLGKTYKYSLRYEYKDGPEHHPILTSSVVNGVIRDGQTLIAGEHVEGTAELEQRKVIPDSEFTLSAFGLPEPHWAQTRKPSWYLWLGVAGVGCLILGGGLAWVRRRRAASVT